MTFLFNIIVGIVIGAAMIIPGVSGGVLAVILGIYDKLLNAIANIFKDFKHNFYYLLPYSIGGIIGILLFSKILTFLFDRYPVPTMFTFMGFIIGGIPALISHIKKNNGKFSIVAYLLAFIFAISLIIMDANNMFGSIQSAYITDVSTIRLFITGILLSIGTIVPGISSFQLLLLIGTYNAFLNAIASLDTMSIDIMLRLIPLGLGLLIGSIVVIKLLSHLIEKHYDISYSAIIGFVMGSIPIIFPNFKMNIQGYIGLLLTILAFFISYKLSRLKE